MHFKCISSGYQLRDEITVAVRTTTRSRCGLCPQCHQRCCPVVAFDISREIGLAIVVLHPARVAFAVLREKRRDISRGVCAIPDINRRTIDSMWMDSAQESHNPIKHSDAKYPCLNMKWYVCDADCRSCECIEDGHFVIGNVLFRVSPHSLAY